MYDTTYHRAASVDEAASLLAANEEAKLISGGQTLLPTMKQRLAAPSDLVDLRHVQSLRGITIDGDKVRIGAATTHAEVAASHPLRAICPGICDLAGHIGDPHVRHMGTIGGSVANNDPSACYPSAMMALNAQIVTNKRTLDTDDFFTGMFETALDDTEIVIAIEFSAPAKSAYAKFPNPASRYAMAGVFVAKLKNGMARVGVTGAGMEGVFRWDAAEEALNANWSPDALNNLSVDVDNMLEDMHSSADYRANLVKVMAKRAVAAS